MKICPNCKSHQHDNTSFCTSCGADISNVPLQAPPAPPAAPYPAQADFSWVDVITIVGFICSLVGLLWCSVILLPIGVVCSLIGFLSTRTKGLAVAGLVISLLGGIIKICVELYYANMIPEWITRGIFF